MLVEETTSEISLLVRKGLRNKAFSRFLQLRRSGGGEEPNEATFSATAGSVSHSSHATYLHCLILKKGYSDHVYVSTSSVSMYSRIFLIAHARQVFVDMPFKDAASWNSMLFGYVHNHLFHPAFALFKDMLSCCRTIWSFSRAHFFLPTILKACSGLGCCRIGKSVHTYALKLRLDLDEFVAGSTIDMYLKCGALNSARVVFNRLHSRDVVVWNTMVAGYAQNCCEYEAFQLFYCMQRQGIEPNEKTYPSVLKALTVVGIDYGRCFHSKTLKSGFVFDVFVGTSIVDMYSKFSHMDDASKVFEKMEMKNLVSFNALITGYSLVGGHEEAVTTYIQLREEGFRPDPFTFMGVFSSCSTQVALSAGTQLHSHVLSFGLDSDVSVGSSIMNFYSKCGMIDSVSMAFSSIHAPNNISWSGLISAYVENGMAEGALKFFTLMHGLAETIDEFSLSSALKAVCSKVSTELGRHLHAIVLKTGLQNSVIVGSSLIDNYIKLGMVEEAYKVFIEIPEKNVVCWNTLITGYSQNGLCSDALLLFEAMKSDGISPTCVTFIGVLSACCYAGMAEDARTHYKSMIYEYGIHPSVEHCTCMVTLLGRCGYLREAEAFLLSSPHPQDHGIWMSLLAACEMHKDTGIGYRAAKKCMDFYPKCSSAYAILSNMYASNDLWSDVETVRDLMNDIGAENNSGCSWIDSRTYIEI